MVRLGPNRYGKAEVRVVTVVRGPSEKDADVVRDRCVWTSLSGDLAATHLEGDNAHVLATDTQKNMVNVFAHRLGDAEPEVLALELGRYFVSSQEPITRARVQVHEYPWERLGGAPHSFSRSGRYVRTTTAVVDAAGVGESAGESAGGESVGGESVVSGVEELVVLNTTNSEFWGFPRDRYTTLPETKDRMLATQVTASWRYRSTDVSWGPDWSAAFDALTSAFSQTYSYSLQQTLFAMGKRIVQTVPAICEVRLTLPNKHHFLVDLAAFGETNENTVYHAADRPYGLIEGSVLADDAPDAGPAWT
jgi:urate oxidase